MASLLSDLSRDPGETAVERALAEIRAARPVVVEGGAGAALITSVEGLEPDLSDRLAGIAAGRARLVLAAARLRRLGLDRKEPGVVACPVLDHARIAHLALKLDDLDAVAARLSRLDGFTVREPNERGFRYVTTPFGLELQLIP